MRLSLQMRELFCFFQRPIEFLWNCYINANGLSLNPNGLHSMPTPSKERQPIWEVPVIQQNSPPREICPHSVMDAMQQTSATFKSQEMMVTIFCWFVGIGQSANYIQLVSHLKNRCFQIALQEGYLIWHRWTIDCFGLDDINTWSQTKLYNPTYIVNTVAMSLIKNETYKHQHMNITITYKLSVKLSSIVLTASKISCEGFIVITEVLFYCIPNHELNTFSTGF